MHAFIHLVAFLALILLSSCGGKENSSEENAASPRSIERNGTTIVVPTPAARPTFASSDLDADGDGTFTYTEFEEAVQRTVPIYDWPAAYHPTADDVLNRFSGGDSMTDDSFEVGIEHTLIGSWHTCAWYRTWLDAYRDGDEVGQAKALQIMTDVIPASAVNSPSAREFERNIAHQAALGDPSLVQRHVELNCGMSFPSH